MLESMEKLEFMPEIKDQWHGVELARKQESQARAGDTQDRTLGAVLPPRGKPELRRPGDPS